MTKLTNAEINAILDEGRNEGEPRIVNAQRLRRFMETPEGACDGTPEGVWDAVKRLTGRGTYRAALDWRLVKGIPGLRAIPARKGKVRWAVTVVHSLDEAHELKLKEHAPAGGELLETLRTMPADADIEAFLQTVSRLVERSASEIRERALPAIADFKAEADGLLAGGALSSKLGKVLRTHLRANAVDVAIFPEKTIRAVLVDALAKTVREVEREAARQRFRDVVGFGDLVERLKASRLPRKVVFHVGPTNPGKTHDAMEALAKASDGVYLAPLRLLALEGYERLRESGLKAGMVTGEESIDADGATHLSMTVEMAPVDKPVEIAVLDEVQLLLDDERGWAWTRALFGLRCRVLHLCGSDDALPLVMRAAEILGERVEVVRHVRKSPLRLESGRVGLDDIRDGDAVVAFSRKNVLLYRQLLIDAGHEVATIYGALSPEVRRAEAARFRSGEATVLVATDAIGMGLNLGPLKRVVFTVTDKFDGKQMRPLRPSEIRQIAGRAGRYGHHDEGLVACMGGQLGRIRDALNGARDREKEDGLFFVKPEAITLDEAARATGTNNLTTVLQAFAERTVFEGSPYKPADMEEMRIAARALDKVAIPVSERFAFAICPVNRRDETLAGWAIMQARNRQIGVPAGPGKRPRPYSGHAYTLDEHEREVHLMTAYLWLSRKFPDTFTGGEEAIKRRRAANDGVEKILARAAETKARKRSPKGEPATAG